LSILQPGLFIIIAIAGSFIAISLRFPAGSIIGAMILVGIVKYFGLLEFDSSRTLSFFGQTLLGLMLGLSFRKISKAEIKRLYLSLIVVLFGIVLMTFFTGMLIYYFIELDIKEVFLSATPGGIAQMATLAQALDLNAPLVVALHIFRVLFILSIFPVILKFASNKVKKNLENENKEIGI
jgi:membrane AbrB-like protein